MPGGDIESVIMSRYLRVAVLETEPATAAAQSCLAGGQTLHVSTDRAFFVVTPWQEITKFNDLQALQAYIAKVGEK